MMKQTNSYKSFKDRIQDIFNFAVLVTLSVPVLEHNLNLFKKGQINRLPNPDYFEPSVIFEIKQETLDHLKIKKISSRKLAKLKLLINIPLNNKEFKEKVIEAIGEKDFIDNRNIIQKQSLHYIENIINCKSKYKTKLAIYLYFSTFSYFEAFILDIAHEIVNEFEKFDKKKYIKAFPIDQSVLNDMIKLNKEFDPRKLDRYKKYTNILNTKGYIRPEQLMFSSLTEIYNNKVENLKANEIPDFLEKTLLFNMTKKERETFHSIRDNRNSIGHGSKSFSPDLNDVIKANKYFKTLSDRIDKHVSYYFLRLKNFDKK